MGTQFTLAVLVTLVPDSHVKADAGPALARLYGILLGMALLELELELEPVLLACHAIAFAGRWRSQPRGAGDRVPDAQRRSVRHST